MPSLHHRPAPAATAEDELSESLARAIDACYAAMFKARLLPQAILHGMEEHLAALEHLRQVPGFAALRARHPGLARFDELQKGLEFRTLPPPRWQGEWPARRRPRPDDLAGSIDERMRSARACGLLPQAILHVMQEDVYVLQDLSIDPRFEDFCRDYPEMLRFARLAECLAW
ncbi:hypothetical protein HLB44_15795 [Aquincola sp. S2]|uniref:Uncharacterized protein n=1 Tax=Pseudaquabacterium terrae TaxID=2732868 RepID=A0ABX2EIK2_9BURK|nr:hypothetical protein [Aquabacterium terrae]NRF68457.1 hypothetical protein [Aquabacterium terrae]